MPFMVKKQTYKYRLKDNNKRRKALRLCDLAVKKRYVFFTQQLLCPDMPSASGGW
jgi:hypothetical protein